VLTWLELDKQFRDLAAHYARLDYQWGAAGVYYRLAGGMYGDAARFEALAQIAGTKLSELPADALHADVMQRDTPEDRWYEALKHHSGAFDHETPATQHDADGTYRGHIYSGSIAKPVAASAVVALKFSVVAAAPPPAAPPPPAPAPEPVFGGRLNEWFHNEREKRGMLWVVAGFILTLILAALALR
jgi:hypothetical protein